VTAASISIPVPQTQGPAGPIGPQGPAGAIDRWISYREFWFDADRADIHPADANKVADIAAYLKQNPSLQVGIDSSMDPNGSDPRNAELNARRDAAIRKALINAGVPASQIRTGAFGDAQLRRDRRVEVLLVTNSSQAPIVETSTKTAMINRDANNTATQIEALDKNSNFAVSNRHDGNVVSATADNLIMTGKDGSEHSHVLARDIKVSLDGKVCKTTDLKSGNRIRVTTDRNAPNAATCVEAIDRNADFAASDRYDGKVFSINADKLVMVGADGNQRTLALAKDVKVSVDGTVCKAVDLKPEMRIRVTTDHDPALVASQVNASN
jgi:hypothetical protein